ncbi:MAG: ankyrin repeat domain-containing protein [bacterium]
MVILGIIIICIGVLGLVAGLLWTLINSFRSGIIWGIIVLFVPGGPLVWLVTHWEDGKLPFLTYLGGVFVFVLGIFVMAMGGPSSRTTKPVIITQDTTASAPAIPSDQDLIAAVEKNDTTKAIKLLNQGAYVNAKNQSGATALYLATQNGNTELVRALLDKRADVNLTNNYGLTALFPAAQKGKTDIVRLLIEKGININAKTETGLTALMVAVSNGRKDSTRALIEGGADVNAKTNDDQTVLSMAKRSEIVDMLRIAGASGPVIPDQMVARTKLQEMGITYNKISFLNCARDGKLEAIKYFLDAGINPNTANKDGVTPLMYVIYHGDTKIVDLMIQKGADVNAKTVNGKTALMIATENNKPNIVAILKAAGAAE